MFELSIMIREPDLSRTHYPQTYYPAAELTSLQVLFSSYRVLSQGVNLHHQCNAMVLMELPQNSSIGIQAMCRIHRLGQLKPQAIYLITVDHTYDSFVLYANARKFYATMAGDNDKLLKAVASTLVQQYRDDNNGEDPHDVRKFERNAMIQCADHIYQRIFGLVSSPLATPYTKSKVLLNTVDEVLSAEAQKKEQGLADPFAAVRFEDSKRLRQGAARDSGLTIAAQHTCALCNALGVDPADCGSSMPVCRHCHLEQNSDQFAGRVTNCIYYCSRSCRKRFRKYLTNFSSQAHEKWTKATPQVREEKANNASFLIGRSMVHLDILVWNDTFVTKLKSAQQLCDDTDPDSKWLADAVSALPAFVFDAANKAASRCPKPQHHPRRCQAGVLDADIPSHRGFDASPAWVPSFDKSTHCLDCQASSTVETCTVSKSEPMCANEHNPTVMLCRFHQEAIDIFLDSLDDGEYLDDALDTMWSVSRQAALQCRACIVTFASEARAAPALATPVRARQQLELSEPAVPSSALSDVRPTSDSLDRTPASTAISEQDDGQNIKPESPTSPVSSDSDKMDVSDDEESVHPSPLVERKRRRSGASDDGQSEGHQVKRRE